MHRGLSPVAYWVVVAACFSARSPRPPGVGWSLVARVRHRTAHDPHRIQGTATRRDIDTIASKKALVRRGQTLRPSVPHPKAEDVGYLLGRSCGREIWASVEDSILVIGPPRSGKGLHLVINAILDAPGAVVTTSTRPDNIAATIRARQERGPVAVFDPQRLTAGLPEVEGNGVRWSPIRGCEHPLTAMIRASGLASSTGLSSGGVESGGFWEGKARSALQALLHAAAIEQLSTRALFEWSLSASAAADAVGILASHPHAAPGWSDSLEGMINSDPRTRDSIWMAVSQALASLADPAVLDAVSPEPGEEFDPARVPRRRTARSTCSPPAPAPAPRGPSSPPSWKTSPKSPDTSRQPRPAPGSTRRCSLRSTRSATSSPLPSLPVLMAEGGGTGITTMPVLQSLSQARSKWGDHAASTIWDASIVKVILGGASASKDLQELSVLIGERDERSDTVTHRRLRRTLASAIDSSGIGDAARANPHAAVRHRPRAAPQRAADRDEISAVDEPALSPLSGTNRPD